jgi:nitroreductase
VSDDDLKKIFEAARWAASSYNEQPWRFFLGRRGDATYQKIFDVLARCLVPAFDGAFLSREWKEALWARFYTGAPQRQRRSVERYNIVKRA